MQKNNVKIMDKQHQILLACRKTILKNNECTWVKTSLDNFDVPMDGYDSAQIADLVGLYILGTLSRKVDLIQLGSYQNDGILCIPIVMVLSVRVYKKR